MDVLSRLAMEAECRQLLVSFACLQDRADGDGMAALFVADGVLVRPGGNVQGGNNIRAHFMRHVPGLAMRNVVSNVQVIPRDNDHADGFAYYASYRHVGGDPAATALPRPFDHPVFVGEYICHLVRTPAGWRIARQEVRRIFENRALMAATGMPVSR